VSKIIAFKTFLRGGQLGPIRHHLSMHDVAALMGTPSSWIDNKTLPFPNYWIYGNLEINFSMPSRKNANGVEIGPRDGQPRVDWFQIENASSLAGDCEIIRTGGGIARQYDGREFSFSNGFGDELVLRLDGITGESRPADFLRLLIEEPKLEVLVERTRETSSYAVQILNGPINIISHFDDPEDDEGVRLARSDAEVAQLVQTARLDSIYSYRDVTALQIPSPGTERRTYTPHAFLAACNQ
jgi:hypothetical protein